MMPGSVYPIAAAPVLGAVAFVAWRLWSRGSRAALARAAESATADGLQRKAPAKPKPAQPSKVDPVASAAAAAEVRLAVHRIAFDASDLGTLVPTAHAKIANQILVALEDAVTQDRYMPRRPRMIPELMRAVNDADSSWRHISTLVARDPALAADLLRIANSAFYRVTEDPVESIDRAVAVLGTNGVRTAISAAVMQPVFKVATAHFRSFPQTVWDHAFMSGIAAETAAALIEDEDPFAAQLLALLMGLGAIVVFRVAEDRYIAESALAPSADSAM
jgi:HDOD domain